MDPKRDDAAPPAASPAEPETFENPQFDALEGAPAAPPAEGAPPPAPGSASPTRTPTVEVATVDIPPAALRDDAPASRAPATTAPAAPGPLPPEAVPPRPPPAPSSGVLGTLLFGVGTFALGVVCTWAVMRRPAEPPPAPPPVPKLEVAAPPSVPAPEPEPKVEAEPAAEEPATEPAHKRPHRAEPAPAPAPTPAAPAAVAKPGAPSMGVLRTYETGDLDAAIKVAQQDRADALLAKLTKLRDALATAASVHGKDPDRELLALESAYQLDRAIDRDSGPIRARLAASLSRALLEAGNRAASKHDASTARSRYQRALEVSPNLPEAKRKLEALGK